MKTLAVIANCGKPRAAQVLQRLAARARAAGWALAADAPTAALLPDAAALPTPELFERADAVLALGGDGTMLRAVRELDGRDKPVLGVNIGGLGFLTSIGEEELDGAIEAMSRGRMAFRTHAIAECRVERAGAEPAVYRALNDVVITRGASPRMITLELAVNGDAVTSYACDGLIVATPAGSTGHSLSAGGPILAPETDAFVITLICPHTLSSRPLIVPDRSEIAVTVASLGGPQTLSVDGQVGQALRDGDRVLVRRSDRSVRFMHLPGHSYFAVLRRKLHWSGSNVQARQSRS